MVQKLAANLETGTFVGIRGENLLFASINLSSYGPDFDSQ